MKLSVKHHIATGAVVGLALLGAWGVASPALAITNPADNPQKIVVKGDDGQSYTDGQDTLPGFDDEECTYIPGAWFDFDNNRVYYADGQSIPWTEWDRTAGYQDWLKKKQASSGSGSGSGSGSTSGGSSGSSTKGSGSKSSSGSSGSGTSGTSTKSGSGSSSSASGSNESSASETASSSADAKKSEKSSKKSTDATDTETSETSGTGLTETGTAVTSTPENTEATGSEASEGGPSPLVGVGILGGLAATGGLAWGGIALRRRAAANAE